VDSEEIHKLWYNYIYHGKEPDPHLSGTLSLRPTLKIKSYQLVLRQALLSRTRRAMKLSSLSCGMLAEMKGLYYHSMWQSSMQQSRRGQ
jgi:hypothetical protein